MWAMTFRSTHCRYKRVASRTAETTAAFKRLRLRKFIASRERA
jgi:hypothetical protein